MFVVVLTISILLSLGRKMCFSKVAAKAGEEEHDDPHLLPKLKLAPTVSLLYRTVLEVKEGAM